MGTPDTHSAVYTVRVPVPSPSAPSSAPLSAPPPPIPGADAAPARDVRNLARRSDAPANGVGAKMSGASLGADVAPPGSPPGASSIAHSSPCTAAAPRKSNAPLAGCFLAPIFAGERAMGFPRLSNAGPSAAHPGAAVGSSVAHSSSGMPCPYAPPMFRPSPAVLPVDAPPAPPRTPTRLRFESSPASSYGTSAASIASRKRPRSASVAMANPRRLSEAFEAAVAPPPTPGAQKSTTRSS